MSKRSADSRRDTEPSDTANDEPNMRADARRNRRRILVAARDIFVDQGAGAPLDEIARRAGVGIATLYRRFPSREYLMRGVALDVLSGITYEARLALAEEPDAFSALARYMHRALDLRIGAVMPALLGQISLNDEEILRLRDESAKPIQAMIDLAQADGTLRSDVSFGDISMMIIRLSRPLPGRFPRDLDNSLAHRHLDLIIDGLRAVSGRPAAHLPGRAMELGDLRSLEPDAEPDMPPGPRFQSAERNGGAPASPASDDRKNPEDGDKSYEREK